MVLRPVLLYRTVPYCTVVYCTVRVDNDGTEYGKALVFLIFSTSTDRTSVFRITACAAVPFCRVQSTIRVGNLRITVKLQFARYIALLRPVLTLHTTARADVPYCSRYGVRYGWDASAGCRSLLSVTVVPKRGGTSHTYAYF